MSNPKPAAAPAESKPQSTELDDARAALIEAGKEIARLQAEATRDRSSAAEALQGLRGELQTANAELKRVNERLEQVTQERDDAQSELAAELESADSALDSQPAITAAHGATSNTASPEPHELPEDHPCYKPLV